MGAYQAFHMTPIVEVQDLSFKVFLLHNNIASKPCNIDLGKKFRSTENKIVGADGTGRK
jgi:hypothetical protein